MQKTKESQNTAGKKAKRPMASKAAETGLDYDAMLEESLQTGSADEDAVEDGADEGVELGASEAQSETKSVGTVIAQSLARESQQSIDSALNRVNGYVTTTKDYVRSQPAEAALIAVTAGLVAYVLLNTKPGRRVFDAGAERYIPEVTKWITQTFAAQSH